MRSALMTLTSRRAAARAVSRPRRSVSVEGLESRRMFVAFSIDNIPDMVEGNVTGGTGTTVYVDPQGSPATSFAIDWEVDFTASGMSASAADFKTPTSGRLVINNGTPTPSPGSVSLQFEGDTIAELEETFRMKFTPVDPSHTVSNGNPQGKIVDDDYVVTITSALNKGTIFDAAGIDAEIQVKDAAGTPIPGKQVDYSVVSGVNVSAPNGLTTDGSGKVTLRLTSDSDWQFNLTAEVSNHSQQGCMAFEFKTPKVEWDGNIFDTLTIAGKEWVGGAVYKYDGVTPFPNVQVSMVVSGDVTPDYSSLYTDAAGEFGQYFRTDSASAGYVYAQIDYRNTSGLPASVSDLKVFDGHQPDVITFTAPSAHPVNGTYDFDIWFKGASGRPVYDLFVLPVASNGLISVGAPSYFTDADGYYAMQFSTGGATGNVALSLEDAYAILSYATWQVSVF